MLAASYPFLDVLWSMVIFFMFFIWIMILFKVFGDLFRRRDIGGGMKTVWIIFVILLPFLGVFIYLIARGGKTTEHRMKDIQDSQAAFNDAVQQAVPVDTAGQLEKLARLRDQGVITPAEFDAQKAKVLA